MWLTISFFMYSLRKEIIHSLGKHFYGYIHYPQIDKQNLCPCQRRNHTIISSITLCEAQLLAISNVQSPD